MIFEPSTVKGVDVVCFTEWTFWYFAKSFTCPEDKEEK